jgi:hypothetical protein
LGLSSLFPYQAFSTTDSESLPIIDTSALVGSTTGALSIGQGAAKRLSILAIMPSASAMSASVCLISSFGIIETHQNTTCPKFYSAVFRLIKFISYERICLFDFFFI